MGELHNFQARRAPPKKPPAPPSPTVLMGVGLVVIVGAYFVYSQVSKGESAWEAVGAYCAVGVLIAALVLIVKGFGYVSKFLRHRAALRKLEADQAELQRQADQGSSISRIRMLQTPTRDPRKIPWREW